MKFKLMQPKSNTKILRRLGKDLKKGGRDNICCWKCTDRGKWTKWTIASVYKQTMHIFYSA